jgi:hypothetical protein
VQAKDIYAEYDKVAAKLKKPLLLDELPELTSAKKRK